MSYALAEFLGTAVLVYLGDAVVANCILKGTKGFNGGWIVITFGWAFAVAIPVLMFGPFSGAHFNPAVTLGLASIGLTPWDQVPIYILTQFLGAFLGAFLVWLQYKDHFDQTDDPGTQLGVFATGPAIRSTGRNFISEFLGTFMLLFTIVGIGSTFYNIGSVDAAGADVAAHAVKAFGVGGIILVIGLSLGGTTGYAINPARDLGPRIMHAILPMKGKGGSDWGYAWIPVIAPILGGVAACLVAKAVGLV
ncbi:MAG: aquaporin family protein [Elusimicrobiota bacterium]|jgi:glycerol uptake facilitator protein|nr:aquaporin family protein [Elusimicrobiota bacterium]